jgi:hypothetical protein
MCRLIPAISAGAGNICRFPEMEQWLEPSVFIGEIDTLTCTIHCKSNTCFMENPLKQTLA